MVKAENKDSFPDLREFVNENEQRLFGFCLYMLEDQHSAEEMILPIFDAFSSKFRRYKTGKSRGWYETDIRIQLFQHAWKMIRSNLDELRYTLSLGRDMRVLKGLDEDLLSEWISENRSVSAMEALIQERIGRVDPDFRAPFVLKDILRFDDDEVIQILGIRWGVYRHRLHRGRLELKEGLRGRLVSSGQTVQLPPS